MTADAFTEVYPEALSPVAIEAKLRWLVSELTRSQQALATMRDAEVKAIHDYKHAYRREILSSECPKVVRGGTTTAERDAWVDDRCAQQEFDRDIATAAREAAADHLRVVVTQSSIAQSLGRSVDSAYRTAGHS